MNRHKLKRTVFTSVILLLLLIETQADTTSVNKDTIQQSQTNVIVQPNQNTSLTESEAYKLLYDNVKGTNDRMMTTIQWVIGISILFLLSILGGQIFFNWKVNTKEIDYIKKDIDEKILIMKAGLIESMAKDFKEFREIIDKKFTGVETQLKEFINANLVSGAKNLDLKIEVIEERIAAEVKELKIDIEKNAGDIWALRGVESNAILNFTKNALLRIELGYEVKWILDDIIKILPNLLDLNEISYNGLDELTSKLTEKHSKQKAQIISLYKDKPVFRYTDEKDLLGQRIKEYVKNKPK